MIEAAGFNPSPEQIATRQALQAEGGGFGGQLGTVLFDAVIEMLEELAA